MKSLNINKNQGLIKLNGHTGGVPSGDGRRSGVASELEDGPLAEGSARDSEDVLGVLDGGDGPGGQHQLLPGLLEVDDVGSVVLALEDVGQHGDLRV